MVTVQPMPGYQETYWVLAGGDILLGFIRLAREANYQWVAHTRSSERSTADMKRFKDKTQAVEWLQTQECV